MSSQTQKIIILGSSGMLGHTLFAHLLQLRRYAVLGTVRCEERLPFFPPALRESIRSGIDADRFESIEQLFEKERPAIVVNCIGIIKQQPQAQEPVPCISINALLPHRLAALCRMTGTRLIHISTDCIFSGRKGFYNERDQSDAEDLYGRTKHLGELSGPGCITLRTSIIGHELTGKLGLVEWFLRQREGVKGYTNAIFSGLPTIELSRVIADHVIPDTRLTGLFHVATDPISKHDLLKLIAATYGKGIDITPDAGVKIDRSLDGRIFSEASGYHPSPWEQLIATMHDDYLNAEYYARRREKADDTIR